MLQCNGDVTNSNKNVTTEIEIDKEIDIEKELQLDKDILENNSSSWLSITIVNLNVKFQFVDISK